jgi:hypothetical protein
MLETRLKTADQGGVTSFSVAGSRKHTTSAGEKREETEWFNCSAVGRLAETCNQFLTDPENGETRHSNDINVTDIQLLGQRSDRLEDVVAVTGLT